MIQMAYPYQVARVTLSGDCFNSTEIWSTGFFLGWEGQDANEITPQGLADISTAWSTFFNATTSFISDKYRYLQCKAVQVSQDGKTIDGSAQYHYPATPVLGKNFATTLPAQCALVATLASDVPRGLASKGRMYLPGVGAAINTDGKVPAATRDGVALNLKNFFDAIALDTDMPGRPVLASLGHAPLNTGGTIKLIQQIRVGDVVDTQRRRRNQLTEVYATQVLSS